MSFRGGCLPDHVCCICGDLVGGASDHAECSKEKKKLFGSSAENKNPERKLSKKKADNSGKFYSELYS